MYHPRLSCARKSKDWPRGLVSPMVSPIRICLYGHDDVHGCTCFCYTDSGNTYLARNSDMFPELKDTSESILYRPDKGYIFLGHNTSFIQMEDGINEHGLAAGINFLMSKPISRGSIPVGSSAMCWKAATV